AAVRAARASTGSRRTPTPPEPPTRRRPRRRSRRPPRRKAAGREAQAEEDPLVARVGAVQGEGADEEGTERDEDPLGEQRIMAAQAAARPPGAGERKPQHPEEGQRPQEAGLGERLEVEVVRAALLSPGIGPDRFGVLRVMHLEVVRSYTDQGMVGP